MYLFKQIDAPNIYAPVRNVQIGLAPLIWGLIRNNAVEKSPPRTRGSLGNWMEPRFCAVA